MIAFALMHATHIAARNAWFSAVGLPSWRAEGIDPIICFDHRRAGIWDTCRRAWLLAHAAGLSYCCVLQDDFVPCPGFLRKSESFVARHPIACLFQPAHGDTRDLMIANREFVLPTDSVAWGGALVLPRELVLPVITLADRMHIFGDMDDMRLTVSLRILDKEIWNVPCSLMRHEGARMESSTISTEYANETAEFRLGYTFDTTDDTTEV